MKSQWMAPGTRQCMAGDGWAGDGSRQEKASHSITASQKKPDHDAKIPTRHRRNPRPASPQKLATSSLEFHLTHVPDLVISQSSNDAGITADRSPIDGDRPFT